MKKRSVLFVALMLVALIAAACGGGAAPVPSGGAKAAPTEKPTEKPAQQPIQPPQNAPAASANPNSNQPDLKDVTEGLDTLNSYKATFSMSFEGTDNGQLKTGSFQSVEEFVKDPAAKRTTITGMNALANNATVQPEDNTMQMIQVNGKEYIITGKTCLQQTSTEAPQAASMFKPSSIIGDIRGAQYIGDETVNGLPTKHYQTDVSGIEALGYVSAQGEVWVAQPGSYVVKYTFQATGKDQFFGNSNSEGTIKWSYEINEVNQPIDIQPPTDCAGAAEDIPVMPDAKDQSSIGQMSTYNTPSKFEDVAAFYAKEMPAKGWTENKDSGFSTQGAAQTVYTKDNRTVTIMITADQSSGNTSVLITEETK